MSIVFLLLHCSAVFQIKPYWIRFFSIHTNFFCFQLLHLRLNWNQLVKVWEWFHLFFFKFDQPLEKKSFEFGIEFLMKIFLFSTRSLEKSFKPKQKGKPPVKLGYWKYSLLENQATAHQYSRQKKRILVTPSKWK